MSIAPKLQLILDTKAGLKAALNVPNGTPFSQYKNFASDNFEWWPKDLFSLGEDGGFYDPSDISTLFQDAAGTTPVTADGDPVGLMLDKSGNGRHVRQELSSARPAYRTDGLLHWLSFDGLDDTMTSEADLTIRQETSMCAAVKVEGVSGSRSFFGIGLAAIGRLQFVLESSQRTRVYIRKVSGEFSSTPLPPAGYSSEKRVLTGILSTSSLDAFFSGTAKTSTSLGEVDGINEAGQAIAINSSPTIKTDFYGGVIVIGRNIETTGERIGVSNYFASKAGIVV